MNSVILEILALSLMGTGLVAAVVGIPLAGIRFGKLFPWLSLLLYAAGMGTLVFYLRAAYRAAHIGEEGISLALLLAFLTMAAGIVVFHLMSAVGWQAPHATYVNLLLHDLLFFYLLLAHRTIAEGVLVYLVSVAVLTVMNYVCARIRHAWTPLPAATPLPADAPATPAPAAQNPAESGKEADA